MFAVKCYLYFLINLFFTLAVVWVYTLNNLKNDRREMPVFSATCKKYTSFISILTSLKSPLATSSKGYGVFLYHKHLCVFLHFSFLFDIFRSSPFYKNCIHFCVVHPVAMSFSFLPRGCFDCKKKIIYF